MRIDIQCAVHSRITFFSDVRNKYKLLHHFFQPIIVSVVFNAREKSRSFHLRETPGVASRKAPGGLPKKDLPYRAHPVPGDNRRQKQ